MSDGLRHSLPPHLPHTHTALRATFCNRVNDLAAAWHLAARLEQLESALSYFHQL